MYYKHTDESFITAVSYNHNAFRQSQLQSLVKNSTQEKQKQMSKQRLRQEIK